MKVYECREACTGNGCRSNEPNMYFRVETRNGCPVGLCSLSRDQGFGERVRIEYVDDVPESAF